MNMVLAGMVSYRLSAYASNEFIHRGYGVFAICLNRYSGCCLMELASMNLGESDANRADHIIFDHYKRNRIF